MSQRQVFGGQTENTAETPSFILNMDQSKNSFAPIVQDDRAARALILLASKKVVELCRIHDEATTSGEREVKDKANTERAELKTLFERLQNFEPDDAKPLTARTLENLDAARRDVEVTLINYETFADDSGEIPDDPELDNFIERLTATNGNGTEDGKNYDENKTNDERDVHLSNRVIHPITEIENDNKQNNASTEVKTPEPANVTAPFATDSESITIITSNQGIKKQYRPHDVASRGSRRSSRKVSSIASSKRETDKEKNEVKIRFLEEQSALEEEIQKMEMEADAIRRDMEAEATRRQMEVESAKRRLKVETLKAEARRDDELARIDEERDVTDEECDEDEISYAESVDRWVESTVAEKVERVSDGNRPDERSTDYWTENKQTNQPTVFRPKVRGNSELPGGNTVHPNPGTVGKPTVLPSPRPPEDDQKTSNFFNTKPFFAQNALGDASQSATHKVTPIENQIPEELREFFRSDTTDGAGLDEPTKGSATQATEKENSARPEARATPTEVFTATPYTATYTAPYTATSAFDRMYEAQLAQIAQNLLVQSRPPKEKLFSGADKKIDFESYWTRFEHVMKTQGTTPTMVVLEIPHWFTGPAAIIIEKYCNIKDPADAVERMKKHLKSEFGRQNLTAKKMLDQLLEGQQIQAKEGEALQTFIFQLENIYQRAEETGRTVTFNTPEIYNTILHRKLSSYLHRWAVEVVKHDRKYAKEGKTVPDMTFEDFIEFLKMQQQITAYRDAMDGEKSSTIPRGNSRYGNRGNDRVTPSKFALTDIQEEEVIPDTDIAATAAENNQTRPNFNSQGRGRPTFRVNPNHNPVPSTKPFPRKEEMRPRDPGVCRVCKATDDHTLEKCPSFLDSQDRMSVCWKTGHCFNCLGHGHVASKCPLGPQCNQCKGKHHSLLHKDPRETTEGGSPSSQ